MSVIRFKTKLFKIKTWTILRLPLDASAKLPSRGQVMAEGTINGYHFQTPLEPDGKGSHWFKVENNIRKGAKAEAGDDVDVEIEPTKKWPEPDVPEDLKKALATHKEAKDTWDKATPLAHWEWLRWIRSTSREETRQKRIEVGCDKLKRGERRPCCWNRNLSTEPYVSKNGILLDPAQEE